MARKTYPKRGTIKGVEVRGEVLLGYLEAMGQLKQFALQQFKAFGITNPQQGQWYPLESLMGVFERFAKKHALQTIGASVIRTAKWPKEIDSLYKALSSIDAAYHMNHRRDGRELFDYRTNRIIEGEIGHDYVIQLPDKKNTLLYVCESFYPCDFDFGMASQFAKQFKPAGSRVSAKIRHDDHAPCRKKGGESCTYILEW